MFERFFRNPAAEEAQRREEAAKKEKTIFFNELERLLETILKEIQQNYSGPEDVGSVQNNILKQVEALRKPSIMDPEDNRKINELTRRAAESALQKIREHKTAKEEKKRNEIMQNFFNGVEKGMAEMKNTGKSFDEVFNFGYQQIMSFVNSESKKHLGIDATPWIKKVRDACGKLFPEVEERLKNE